MDFDEDIFLKTEGKWICMKLKANHFGSLWKSLPDNTKTERF